MAAYRLLMALIGPVVIAALLLRVLRGREGLSDLNERLGGGGPSSQDTLWVHGASNGELTSARSLVTEIQAALPDRAIVLTANTLSGRALVQSWALPGVAARLAPLDLRWVLGRFRGRHRPVGLVTLENELWPNRFATQTGPVLCVGARISTLSARRWPRGLAAGMLSRVRLLVPQDAASGPRFLHMGLPPEALAAPVPLKASVQVPAPDPETLRRLSARFDRAETVLAASTHEGEEAQVLDAFQQARQTRPALHLILAPRHPPRAEAVRALAEARGLHVARHSRLEDPAGADVYLMDALGEMALCYSLASVTFVGGSLVPKGGHTPFEPAQFGSAILHGPHVDNFVEAYEALDANGGALAVQGGDALAAAFSAPRPQATPAQQILAALDADPKALAAQIVQTLR